MVREHQGSRTETRRDGGQLLIDIWKARSLGIVSLLAGRDQALAEWRAFLLEAELPRKCSLYVVDNSGRADFRRRAFDAAEEVAVARGLERLELRVVGTPYVPVLGEPYLSRERHLHVARLYAAVLPQVREDL